MWLYTHPEVINYTVNQMLWCFCSPMDVHDGSAALEVLCKVWTFLWTLNRVLVELPPWSVWFKVLFSGWHAWIVVGDAVDLCWHELLEEMFRLTHVMWLCAVWKKSRWGVQPDPHTADHESSEGVFMFTVETVCVFLFVWAQRWVW